MKRISELKDIPKRNYEGYLWMSDAKNPICEVANFDFNSVAINPFIIEGLLYSRTDNISILIRHTGKYHIYEYDLNRLPDGSELVPIQYVPHRLDPNIKKVSFSQLWLPETDEQCENMPTLKMKALLFTGFINQ